MEAPLLMRESSPPTESDDYLEVKNLKDAKFVLCSETVKLWKIAGPVALSSLFQYLTVSSLNIYAGHLGDIVLSSISLYLGVISCFYYNFLFGMSSALLTLCGQAYGAGQVKSTGIYLQRSWIVLTMSCIILLPTHIYATPILEFLGQDKEISELAGNYALKAIPSMFSFAFILPTQRFLQAQSKVMVITCITFVALLVQNLLLYVFIYGFNWGSTGLAMAHNVSHWVLALALVVYASCWCKEGWSGYSFLAFKDLLPFTWLSLSLSVMTCLEQWYSTFIVLLAGHLDNPVIALASYSICINIQGWYLMLLLGISTAISVRVSNTLGMSHPRAARYSFIVTMCESLFIGISFMSVVLLCKQNLAMIFTNSEDLIRAVADLAYLLALSMLLSSVSQVISGVAIGSGWQVMIGYINLACYYIVGLSLGYFLGFNYHLGLKGLWGGTQCGSVIQIFVLIIIIWKTNWTKEVEQTANRMRIWGSSNHHKEMI
ncbi:hypothetical protein HN51_071696 [Arachis hypogaea]|uniref:protein DETOXIFICATION 35 n=1 Tax=Arachis hypogaea TaxID=3818 RepID=UPI000DED270E|nr:protein DETOXIFICATION 35 [Arachis hypogaea]QHO14316.1 Protein DETOXIFICATION [Arachis hypogaea]